ncbi:MAG: histidine phosphatase family protein [Microlunatus sp.]|nr:histidine phosphatase family protein [Microlunatus sp.]
MPGTVIIVRHAEPEVRADLPPASWPLSPAGRLAAAGLHGTLPAAAGLASSSELKAIETICLAAAVEPEAVTVDDHFGEVRRPGEPFDDHHRDRRLAWITGRPDARHAAWETPEQAARRFQDGLDQLDGEIVVVGTHGMIITAWLVAIGEVRPGDAAGACWQQLAFPDVLTITLRRASQVRHR